MLCGRSLHLQTAATSPPHWVRGAPSSRSRLYHVTYMYRRNGGLTYCAVRGGSEVYERRECREDTSCVSLEEHIHSIVILRQTLRHKEVGVWRARSMWRQHCLSTHVLGTRAASHVTCFDAPLHRALRCALLGRIHSIQ